MINNLTLSLGRVFALLFVFLALSACKERSIQDEVFYFVLPDRFHNGDPANDNGAIPGIRDDNGYDPESEAYYHGGDIAGLQQKLPYLKEMGVTAIWMTPVFKNDAAISNSAGYHGYWTLDYTQVDPHLGSNAELAALIEKAHKMGLKVFFDIVVNHTADVIGYEECHNPDGSLQDGLDNCPYVDASQSAYTPFVPAGREAEKVPAWLNDPARYNNRGDSTFSGESSVLGDFYGLDDLNTADPQVVEGMIEVFKFWISEFKIDGFRLDTVKHVDMGFWQAWTPAIMAHAEAEGVRNFFIFGEVFDGNPRVISRYTTEGGIPSALDFGLYYASRDVFAHNSGPSRLAGILAEDDWYTDGDSDASSLMNFVSNHDVGRLGREIRQANPEESDAEHLARLKLAYALNYFGRGIPVVYYGDEQGFVGDGGDTGSREDMMPSEVAAYNDNDLIGTDATTADDNFNRRHPMYRSLRAYAKVLDQYPALRQGRMFIRHVDDSKGLFAFSRVLDSDAREVLVVMNTSKEAQTLTLPASADRYKSVYPKSETLHADAADEITVSVPALSFRAYQARQKIDTPDISSVFLHLSDSAKVSGRFEVPAGVVWEDDALLPQTVVTFEVSVNGGEFEKVGVDKTPDYRLIYDADQHEEGALLTFRAKARNPWSWQVSSEEITVEVGVEPGIEVIFKKPSDWGESVNVYSWNADPQPVTDWPGVAAESLGNDWFRFQFEDGVQFANLIFNDGQGHQTEDLFRDKDGCYIAANWVDTCDPDTDGGSDPGATVYFRKPVSWGAPNVYFWNAGVEGPEWPGVAMESLGDDWYKYQFPGSVQAANLVFNDGNQQSGDLYREGDGCYALATDSWTDTCAIPGFKVYFQKPEDWGSALIYYWNTDAPAGSVSWPGVAMEDIGSRWFSFQFPAGVTAANVIFNNGDGAQSADLYREGDGCYDITSDSWADDCDHPQPGILVRFKKPEGWGDGINVYYWNAEPAPAVEWPGVPVTSLGDGWYEYQFPSDVGAANLIFNDGEGNQTADLYREADGCYGENGDVWSDTCVVPDNRVVSIEGFRGHWLNADQLVWQYTDNRASSFKLLASSSASMVVEDNVLTGADLVFELVPGEALSEVSQAKFRHLADWPVLSVTAMDSEIRSALQGQLILASYDADGHLLEATYVQTPGVIDELFAYEGELGTVVEDGQFSVRLWAPTAQSVKLKLYNADKDLIGTIASSAQSNGVYIFSGDSSWQDQYYRFEVQVYHPLSDQIETYEVTDPYSLSLSMDSQYSQFVDIANDPSLKPAGWDALVKPLPAARDISIYEGHVRDFSAHDPRVPVEYRGKYKAFSYNGENGMPLSAGMAHLKALKNAGLTHFHVLPVNDLASIKESPEEQVNLDDPYSRLCNMVAVPSVQEGCDEFGETSIRDVFTQLKDVDPVNARIQAINYDLRTEGFPSVDGFNWGYDPYHFNVAEGSYATNPEGKARILEFREMVKALDEIGLNLVVDVVFNHTYASGLYDKSVLDKVVPGYYHRRNVTSGAVESSTCCDNTAAEHEMMEHLMVQSLQTWAQYYKVDAFRFDLMGHHPKMVMQDVQESLAQLTLTEHGVDGARIYLYGEGWDFGEVAGSQRFDQATQPNMAGTGVGTFNDRLRDAVRGGNFTDRGRSQGFANGNVTYPNGVADGAGSIGDQAGRIRIGLAGNLRNYPFEDNSGAVTTGQNYSGVGYTADPQENIVYIDKHDNETLWDNTQAKLPDNLGMDDRVRVQVLSQAFVNFAQGIPFHQMGSDLLRSKSMGRDSFDAGDWFNKVDFTLQHNNWAVGLPSEDKNGPRWPVMSQIMSNPNIAPQPEHIERSSKLFREQLAIRYSTPLLRLDNADDVNRRVSFLNSGVNQVPGLIAMAISDGACSGEELDDQLDGVLVLFNADDEMLTFGSDVLSGQSFELHETQQSSVGTVVQAASYDAGGNTFSIPARTAAVFVVRQAGGQGEFPCNPHYGSVTEPGFTVYFNNTEGWESVSAYYWDTTPATPSIEWPGVAMSDLGDGWYSYTFPNGVTAANLIFNNQGGGAQSSDLYREGDGCYTSVEGWADECVLPGLKFWFEKPDAWGESPNFYYWGASVEGPGWPGTPMENLGNGWYFFQMPEGVRSSNLIFNDAGPSGTGAQTPDLFRSRNGCYLIDGGWSDSCDVQ
ncbi:pullulanase-type alpha-1,6-glucosidase [Hahella ganghwensis]|uniref:pullulanase-type alpha-1,6-glucosidase n=1 Tax=Hahella ganghwensis TaxID=286420 RepID=UPI000367BE7A|nr:pullulanase-type alpha-1,6-glucosidase [Hahella ganghwensis]